MTSRPGLCAIRLPFHTALTLLTLLVLAGGATRASAQPSPLDSNLWSFPSTTSTPASAISGSRALADRWLGEQPFDNPAGAFSRRLAGSGLLEHLSRQDLRSDNRRFSEQVAFFDFAGAWAAMPLAGFQLAVYASQPVLRLEDNAFSRGEPGAITQPAVIQSSGTSRELRAGFAISRALGPARLGAAAEWTRRSDVYEITEQSGSPDQGFRHLDFSGDGFGAQAGITWGEDQRKAGDLVWGMGGRFVPELEVKGEQRFNLLSGDSLGTVTANRDLGFELGTSVGYRAQENFRVLVGVGGRTEHEWTGFGLRSGSALQWSVGGEYHDTADPWTFRFGIGQEHEKDIQEFRSGLIGLGLGWKLDHSTIDFGLLHRTIERHDHPTSFDDRLVVSVVADF